MASALPFRTYLFDLDGTLIDHFSAIHRCYTHTLAQFGKPALTRTQTRAAVGGGLEQAMAKFFSPAELPEAMRTYREHMDRTLVDDVVLMPGARELLAALHARGATLVVITNKLGSYSRRICAHLGLSPYLQAVIGAEDTAWLKPAPEFTRHVLAALGAEAGTSVLIGDSPYDVKAAHAGGLPAWCVTIGTHSAEELKEAGADRVFASLPELGSALLRG